MEEVRNVRVNKGEGEAPSSSGVGQAASIAGNFQARRNGALNTAIELFRLIIEMNPKAFSESFNVIDSETLKDQEKLYQTIQPFFGVIKRLANDVEQIILTGFEEGPEYSRELAKVANLPITDAQKNFIKTLATELGYEDVKIPETRWEASQLIDTLKSEAYKRRADGEGNVPKEEAVVAEASQSRGVTTQQAEQVEVQREPSPSRKEEERSPTRAQVNLIQKLAKEIGVQVEIPKTIREASKLIEELQKEREKLKEEKKVPTAEEAVAMERAMDNAEGPAPSSLPPSEKQIQYIKKLASQIGIEELPQPKSKEEASEIIEQYKSMLTKS